MGNISVPPVRVSSQSGLDLFSREMEAPSLTFLFVVLLSVINMVVRGVPTEITRTLTERYKTDGEGYHKTCISSKPGYNENFKWRYSLEPCILPFNLAKFHLVLEDKYNKISSSENDDQFLSTLTLIGATGNEDGPKQCVCCTVEVNDALCANLTRQHERPSRT